MKIKMKELLAAALGLTVVCSMPSITLAQEASEQADEPATQSQPETTDEPSIDELLGLDEKEPGKNDKPAGSNDPEPGDEDKLDSDPKLTRDLDKALTGQQAADQFAQAIEEMEEVAIRLADEADPGIDTQRLQDEIILKLEEIIASAEKQKSKQKPKPGQGQPQQGQPREADRQQGQQQGEQPGDKPGEQPGEQQGQKPGDQRGDQPGQQQGEQPGEGDGQQPGGQQAGGRRAGRPAAGAMSETNNCR